MRHPELAQRLPDIPRWIEVRDLLLAGLGEISGLRQLGNADELSFVLRDTESSTLFIVGEVVATEFDGVIATTLRDRADVVAPIALTASLTAALPTWSASRLIVHTLTDPTVLERLPLGETGWATLDELRSCALPDELMAELEVGGANSPIAVSRVAGQPVSFCYAGSQTETLWDVSIDTLEAFRRQGHAARSAALMVRHMTALGKRPVWQALENNPASWHLAARLGFTPCDELVMLEAPDDQEV